MTSFKNKIGVSDVSLYDGKNRTFPRATSTGGSLTVPRIGNIVDVLAVYGDGVTIAEQNLLDAIANIGTTEACIELAPGSWPITANLTPGANFTFRLRRGAVFTVSAGITLDLSSCMVFPEEATWTAGTGTITTVPENVCLPGAFGKVLVTTNDTMPAFLATKLVAGTNITLTASGPGAETLTAAGSTTPTISSFANGTHTHAAAASGGEITFNTVNQHTHAAASSGGVLAAGALASVVASKVDMEAGTSAAVAVTPGFQQYHASAAKGWVNFNGTGALAVNASYNVTGVTDNGTGDYTITWETDFSSANYAVVILADVTINSDEDGTSPNVKAVAGGTFRFTTWNDIGNALEDVAYVSAVAFGDQ